MWLFIQLTFILLIFFIAAVTVAQRLSVGELEERENEFIDIYKIYFSTQIRLNIY